MMTRGAESVKPAECGASIIKLVIEIETPRGSDRYTVDPLNPGGAGVKAFRLSKHGREGLCYDVVQGADGIVECDCADYEFRRKGRTPAPCKHGSSLISLGLLAAPSVAPTPAPVPCCTELEVTPCAACLTAPAEPPSHYEDEAPELSAAEMHDPEDIDPADVESDPELWPADPRWDGWFATPIEPEPEPEPAVIPGIDYARTFTPSREDAAWNAASTAARPSLCKPTRTRVRFDRPL